MVLDYSRCRSSQFSCPTGLRIPPCRAGMDNQCLGLSTMARSSGLMGENRAGVFPEPLQGVQTGSGLPTKQQAPSAKPASKSLVWLAWTVAQKQSFQSLFQRIWVLLWNFIFADVFMNGHAEPSCNQQPGFSFMGWRMDLGPSWEMIRATSCSCVTCLLFSCIMQL